MPGIVDERAGLCVQVVNLGWHDVPVRDLVAAELGVPLAFGQDVRAGALAEVRTGAAAGSSDPVLFAAVGTGPAGTFVVDGQVLDSVGRRDRAGALGEGGRIEEVASSSALARRAGAPDASGDGLRARAA